MASATGGLTCRAVRTFWKNPLRDFATIPDGHLVGHTHTREPEPDSVEKAELEAA